MSRRRTSLLAVSAVVPLLLAGCGGGSESAGTSSSASQASASATVDGSITVLAAASLQEAFTTIGSQFEKANPGTKVTFSFGPSSGLATSINQGAPADVFASASPTNMDQVVSAGRAADPKTFVSNQMEIAVPPKNPADVHGLDDLAKSSVKVALCQPQVPCGAVAAKVFTNARIKVTPVTQEVDVKSVLTKVILGEVDAGVVYVTDVRAAGSQVKGIEIPADVNASTDYPIATVSGSKNAGTAAAFMAYVLSPQGQTVLTSDGFATP